MGNHAGKILVATDASDNLVLDNAIDGALNLQNGAPPPLRACLLRD